MTTPVGIPSKVGPGRRTTSGVPALLLGAVALVAGLALLTAVRSAGGPATDRAGGAASAAAIASATAAAASPGAPVDPARYLIANPAPAPRLALTDQDGQPFDLISLRGQPTFVFFGYTHCPDVCPATVGTVGLAMEAAGIPTRAVFVTVDPERDTPSWLKQYVRYLEKGFNALTGTPAQISATAAAWGVRYAKVETGTPGEYSMSHTADVVLIDGDGRLRARFPFGTSADAMTATLHAVVAVASSSATPPDAPPATGAPEGSVSPAPSASTPPAPAGGLAITVGSSSVWAGPAGPILFSLAAAGNRIDDPGLAATLQVTDRAGNPAGGTVAVVPVQPPGESRVVYVASPAIPSPGWWRLVVTTVRSGITLTGTTDIAALDPGTSAPIGAPAPTVSTPTIDSAGGVVKAVTTDPAPDLRLSRTSTTDALAAHQPFVLVIDSWKFKVTSACGRALVMARYLIDRWPSDAFIHLEPLLYDVVTDTPVLRGSLGDPTLTPAADAWGLGGAPWGPTSMPWVFVVDGNGIVRAKAEGVMGSDDVDVILALIAAGH